jgi:hypothetical protein
MRFRHVTRTGTQIANNLREEIALNSSDPGMMWNPDNPHYLLRDGCR